MRHGFLRFPRNRPIIYLVRHSVIGQLFLPNMFLFRASRVSLVLLQTQVYEKAWVN